MPIDNWDMVLGIDFFYESNELMIMDEASPCMVLFMRGMSTGVALSSIWVIETSEPHEDVKGNGVSKACKRSECVQRIA